MRLVRPVLLLLVALAAAVASGVQASLAVEPGVRADSATVRGYRPLRDVSVFVPGSSDAAPPLFLDVTTHGPARDAAAVADEEEEEAEEERAADLVSVARRVLVAVDGPAATGQRVVVERVSHPPKKKSAAGYAPATDANTEGDEVEEEGELDAAATRRRAFERRRVRLVTFAGVADGGALVIHGARRTVALDASGRPAAVSGWLPPAASDNNEVAPQFALSHADAVREALADRLLGVTRDGALPPASALSQTATTSTAATGPSLSRWVSFEVDASAVLPPGGPTTLGGVSFAHPARARRVAFCVDDAGSLVPAFEVELWADTRALEGGHTDTSALLQTYIVHAGASAPRYASGRRRWATPSEDHAAHARILSRRSLSHSLAAHAPHDTPEMGVDQLQPRRHDVEVPAPRVAAVQAALQAELLAASTQSPSKSEQVTRSSIDEEARSRSGSGQQPQEQKKRQVNFTYRVWAGAAPGLVPPGSGPFTDIMPMPNSQVRLPPFSTSRLVTLAHLDELPVATSWLTGLSTNSYGNNVDAYADLSAPDGFTPASSDMRADLTGMNTFDRTFDPQLAANTTTQRAAIITQLFFSTNWAHDWLYAGGFDEASGNAQIANFGRGGEENDPVLAEAQDSSGLNNANMQTPADGSSPRMQMYLWTSNARSGVEAVLPGAGLVRYEGGIAEFGDDTFSVNASMVFAGDGCPPLATGANMTLLSGRVALVERGNCSFVDKALAVQAAGAVGIVVADSPTTILGGFTAGGTEPNVTLGVVTISHTAGVALRDAILAAPGGELAGVHMYRADIGPRPDSSMDGSIVLHEYAHMLSNRLVGGQLGSLQAGGMGEGWSDFVALLAEIGPGELSFALSPATRWVVGAYSSQSLFGLRRFSYSSDLAVSPLMFHHIESNATIPPGASGSGARSGNAEVHNSGEVWCAALLDAYAHLVNDCPGGGSFVPACASPRMTNADAAERMRAYIIDGLRLTPPNPTFVEARAAILAAARAADPLDSQALCAGFAKRGMGSGARAPARNAAGNEGVFESFVCGGVYDVDASSVVLSDSGAAGTDSCDRDGVLDTREIGALRFTVANVGSEPLAEGTATVSFLPGSPDHVDMPGGQPIMTTIPALEPGEEHEIVLTGMTLNAAGRRAVSIGVSLVNPALPALSSPLLQAGRYTFVVYRVVDTDVRPSSALVDTFDAPLLTASTGWTASTSFAPGVTPPPAGEGHVGFEREVEDASTDLHLLVHAPDAGVEADSVYVSPSITVDTQTATFLTFSFRHRYDFEESGGVYYDGGVIELSSDNGASWSDITAFSENVGDLVTLGTVELTMALRGRTGYGGRSPGYPNYISETLRLGNNFGGETIRIRFRVASDEAVGAAGWHIDDFSVGGVSGSPFSLVADNVPGPCVTDPTPPTISAASTARAAALLGHLVALALFLAVAAA